MGEDSSGDLTFYYRAAALSRIYRFIKEQELTHGGFRFQTGEKIAFFPGTFDPFTPATRPLSPRSGTWGSR